MKKTVLASLISQDAYKVQAALIAMELQWS